VFQVLLICVPIFALIAFGVVLRRTGLMTEEGHAFLSRFVYLFCLPVLIFLGIASKDFGELLKGSIVASTLLVTAVVAVAFWLASGRLPRRLRGPVAMSPFFANLTYLGFPLAERAYGAEGLTSAGIINAFTMPVFVVLAVSLLAAGQGGGGPDEGERRWLATLRTAVINPIVLAVFGGLAMSFLVHEAGLGAWAACTPLVSRAVEFALRTLEPVGQMGLPMALIAVGASLRFGYVRGRLALMFGCAAAKLLLTPALTLAACRLLFPAMGAAATGTTVLLMGSPLSVGCYVISRELDTDSDFIAGLLVVTTVGACATIPFWLAVLL
jgi:hypothetical protein